MESMGIIDKNPTTRLAATNPVPDLGLVDTPPKEEIAYDEKTINPPKKNPKIVGRKGLRFLQLAYHIHQTLFQDELMIGGFYNWPKVMDGEFDYYSQKKGKLKNYDIIFVGLSRPEIEGCLLSKIRREIGPNSRTKIIVSVDYAVPLWQNSFNLHLFENELKQADAIFIAEPSAMSCVACLVNEEVPIFFMPHPTDVEMMKRYCQPIDERFNALLVLIHRYDNNWYVPALITKDLKDIDTYAIFLDGSIELHITPFFQYVRSGARFSEYLKFASRSKIVLDSYHQIANYGRNAVDNACLKIPTIATNKCFANTILWPDLTTQPNDAMAQKRLIQRLMYDKEFYTKAVEFAFDKVEMFNYRNSYANMADLYNRVCSLEKGSEENKSSQDNNNKLILTSPVSKDKELVEKIKTELNKTTEVITTTNPVKKGE